MSDDSCCQRALAMKIEYGLALDVMDNMGKAKFHKGTIMFLALSGDGTVTCICDGKVVSNSCVYYFIFILFSLKEET